VVIIFDHCNYDPVMLYLGKLFSKQIIFDILALCVYIWGIITKRKTEDPVSVGVKLSFVEPGCRWAHSPSLSKAPGISYQGTMKTSVRMLETSGGF